MHDQSGRLVDNEQVLVFVNNRKRDGFGPEGLALRRGAQFDREGIAGLHPVCRARGGAAINPHCTIVDELLQVAAGELGHELRQRAIEALAMHVGRHAQLAQFRLGAGLGLVVGDGRGHPRSYNRPALVQEGFRCMSLAKLSCAVSATALALALAGCSSLKEDRTASMTVEKIASEAREEINAGAWDKAIPLLEKLEGRAAGTPLAQQAQLERAYAYYKQNEQAQALATLDRFIKLHPASPALDYALYLKGIVNFNDNLGLLGNLARQDLSERDQQASRDSYQAFKQLVERFPQSQYAADARLRMTYIINSRAAYEVHVAR
jgi:outer membrane assembly lipoprotein YfiO